jgi:hypothetical protein
MALSSTGAPVGHGQAWIRCALRGDSKAPDRSRQAEHCAQLRSRIVRNRAGISGAIAARTLPGQQRRCGRRRASECRRCAAEGGRCVRWPTSDGSAPRRHRMPTGSWASPCRHPGERAPWRMRSRGRSSGHPPRRRRIRRPSRRRRRQLPRSRRGQRPSPDTLRLGQSSGSSEPPTGRHAPPQARAELPPCVGSCPGWATVRAEPRWLNSRRGKDGTAVAGSRSAQAGRHAWGLHPWRGGQWARGTPKSGGTGVGSEPVTRIVTPVRPLVLVERVAREAPYRESIGTSCLEKAEGRHFGAPARAQAVTSAA